MSETDFLIIGSGSAGSVIANRLSASGRHRVTVLEAGGSDLRPSVQVPIGYGMTYFDPRVNWKYLTEPIESLGGRCSYWPRGKVLGGSSSINAMVYVRGHPQDFDDWGKVAPGWAWCDVEPYFRRLEDWTGAKHAARGVGGPLTVTDMTSEVHPMCEHFLRAAETLGLPFNTDYNAEGMSGTCVYQLTTRGGLRASTARCYLRPALKRDNLRLITKALVTRIVFQGQRVVGVEYRRLGKVCLLRAAREVIVCAGAINSPQLLQLSGVGPEALLREHGVDVVCDAPAVGCNLQDHLGVDHLYRVRVPSLNEQLGTWWGRVQVGLRYLLKRRGPLSMSVNQAGGFVCLDASDAQPDIQLYFSPLSYTRAQPNKRALMSPDPFPGMLLGFNACRPSSKGHLQIRSPDPMAAPAIHPNYLASEHDRQQILAGSRLLKRIAAAPPLSAIIEQPIRPDVHDAHDEELLANVRDHAWTVFHPTGTCRMGASASTNVVDPRLRVFGVEGLRVADASTFPCITSGNTNAPVIMLAEKASDLILEDARKQSDNKGPMQ